MRRKRVENGGHGSGLGWRHGFGPGSGPGFGRGFGPGFGHGFGKKVPLLPVCVLAMVTVLTGCGKPQPAQPGLAVEITGADYNWHIRYPGSDGELGTPDDVWTQRHLHLPANTTIDLKLLSRDFLYNFWLPDRNVYEIAVPDVPMGARFDSGPARAARLLGDQMCGFSHEELIGELVVQPAADFERWLQAQRATSAGLALPNERAATNEG